MLIEFDRYLNVRLCEGLYYVHVVNIDEAISQMGIVNLSVKFATAEGFFVKEYLLDERGMRSFYDDFIADFYWTNLHPINDQNKESKFNFDLLDSVFDTNMHLLNREFEIVIEYIDGRNEITAINPCMIAHAMSQRYTKPFYDNFESEHMCHSDMHNGQAFEVYLDSDFEFGGLRGEEAETMYWNID
jgi:hypothetical protein